MELLYKALSKFTLELIGGFVIVWLLTFVTRTKGYTFLIFLSVKLNLGKLFTFLFSGVLHHKIYGTLHVLKGGEYLRHINNQDYRGYMETIVMIVYRQIYLILKSFEGTIAIDMFYLSRKEFVMLLTKLVLEGHAETAREVRQVVQIGSIDSKFAKKYLTWVELVYDSLRKRISDIENQPNNYHSYIKFLHIVNDFLESYINLIAPSINNINGEVLTGLHLTEQEKKISELLIKIVEIAEGNVKTKKARK